MPCPPRAARASLFSPSPPLVLGRFSVSSKEGLGGDQEGSLPASRQQTAEHSKDGPVRRAIPHACVELALEDAHLGPERHDLDVLVGLGATCGPDKTEEPAQAEVDQREGHDG